MRRSTGAQRRIVTGHAPDGASVIVEDGAVPMTQGLEDGTRFEEIWLTGRTPAPIAAREPEPTQPDAEVPPPPAGTLVRMVEIPPGARSPMHRTESVDYGVMIAGELHLVLDSGEETALHPGDVVVQRGTNHLWDNRGGSPARIVFVLVGGDLDQGLRRLLS